MKIRCAQCGKWTEKSTGHANRARKLKARMFCSRKCFGLFWRSNKTNEEKKAEKAAYDKKYNRKNQDWRAFQNAFWFVWDYQKNAEKYRQWRRRRMKAHVDYCRRPEYKKWKKKYDESHMAAKKYGDFAEAALILKKLEGMIDRQRARIDKDCHNKTKKRKKLWKNLQQSTLKKPYGKRS